MLYQAYRNAKCTPYPGGFTLVELLVVVAVISMLTAILTPTLHAARQRARTTACAARLQQWGLAFACYANENRGVWPHCDGLDRGPRPLSHPRVSREDVADWHGWVDLLPPLVGLKPWRDYPRGQYPDETTFYHCAYGRLIPGRETYDYYPQTNGYFSYAMNSCLELDRNAWPPPGSVGYPMPSFLDTGRIMWPAEVIVLFDQLLDPSKGFDGNRVYRGAGKHCGSYPKAFSARHRRGGSKLGGNVLYADGHVKCRPGVWKPEWDVSQEVPPRDDTNWYPYPAWEGS